MTDDRSPQNCVHTQWHDDSEPHEEHIVMKCNNCGIFKATDEANPIYDAFAGMRGDQEPNPEADYAEARAVEYAQAEERWHGGRAHGPWCPMSCECNQDYSSYYEPVEGEINDTQATAI